MRFFLLLLFLAGCTAAPTREEPGVLFDLQGRIAVKYDDHGYYGNLRWRHRKDSEEIDILSPLGQMLAHIEENRDGATLTTGDQKRYQAADVESLTRKVLGWQLPLAGLKHWVVGHADKTKASLPELDSAGRLVRLRQQDWEIDYPRYYPEGKPKEISLHYGELGIKLVIDSWGES